MGKHPQPQTAVQGVIPRDEEPTREPRRNAIAEQQKQTEDAKRTRAIEDARLNTIAEQQKEIGYESVFVEGAKQSKKYMTGLFNDWQAQNITSVLHEKRGGYANNVPSMMGLAAKARAEGVSIHEGVEVLGYESANTNSDAIQKVITDQGAVECDHVVISVGPWIKRHWDMLELPDTIPIKDQRGITHLSLIHI